jgi:hypothetical protein
MSENGETDAMAIVARLFKDKDALLGTERLDSVVGTGWKDSSLHHLVKKPGTLSATKMKETYGHFRTTTQKKGCEGPYWTPDPNVMVKEWNTGGCKAATT